MPRTSQNVHSLDGTKSNPFVTPGLFKLLHMEIRFMFDKGANFDFVTHLNIAFLLTDGESTGGFYNLFSIQYFVVFLARDLHSRFVFLGQSSGQGFNH